MNRGPGLDELMIDFKVLSQDLKAYSAISMKKIAIIMLLYFKLCASKTLYKKPLQNKFIHMAH